MISLLLRYGAAVHVALLVVYASWARGGSAPAYFWAIPWLALGIVELMFLLPPATEGVSPRHAVRRVWHGLLRDPIFYIGAVLILFLLLQWLNGPREMIRNPSTATWEYSPPPWPGLPFCVDRGEAAQVLLWAIGVYAILLAVRHGMPLEARRWLLRVIVYNGVILSAVGLLHLMTDTKSLFWIRPMEVYFFSTFGYPNHASAFFTLVTAINLGLLFEALGGEDQERSGGGWLMIALVMNLLGVFFALGRAGMVLTLGILALAVPYGIIYLWRRTTLATSMRLAVLTGGLALCAGFFIFAVPNNPIIKELKTINLLQLHKQLQGDRAELAHSAIEIWQDYPWAGVGGWGFRRYVGIYMGPEKYDYLRVAGRANVHNDAIQYLCEHGVIGMALILGLVFVIVGQLWFRLAMMPRKRDDGAVKSRSWFMSVSPVVWFCIIGTSATVIHSLIDLPFRNMAIISVWFIALASAPYFVPRRPAAATQAIPPKVTRKHIARGRSHSSSNSSSNNHHPRQEGRIIP
ncbi:MAG: O-antigen ligase family protein [Kiritimatiellia bacterium]